MTIDVVTFMALFVKKVRFLSFPHARPLMRLGCWLQFATETWGGGNFPDSWLVIVVIDICNYIFVNFYLKVEFQL